MGYPIDPPVDPPEEPPEPPGSVMVFLSGIKNYRGLPGPNGLWTLPLYDASPGYWWYRTVKYPYSVSVVFWGPVWEKEIGWSFDRIDTQGAVYNASAYDSPQNDTILFGDNIQTYPPYNWYDGHHVISFAGDINSPGYVGYPAYQLGVSFRSKTFLEPYAVSPTHRWSRYAHKSDHTNVYIKTPN